MAPGVFFTETSDPGWHALVCAAVLIGGQGSRAGGSTAATLLGLHDVQELPVDILVPLRAPTRASWARFTRDSALGRGDSGRSFPPCLNIVDTVLDLCAGDTRANTVGWLSSAVRKRLTTPKALIRGVQRRSRQGNRALILGVLEDVQLGVQSNLEFRYLNDVERAHGLPRADRQFAVPGTGKHADAAYPVHRVLIELDGRLGHERSEDRFRDRRRDNAHSIRGWLTVRFGWADVTGDPCAVAAQVADVLRDCGWTGSGHPCPRCLRAEK